MNLQDILTAISTVGFPIVAFGAMFWYNYKTVNKINESVNENTKVTQELSLLIKNLSDKK